MPSLLPSLVHLLHASRRMRLLTPALTALMLVVAGCGGDDTTNKSNGADMTASADLLSNDSGNATCHFPNGDACDPVIGCSNGCSWCGCTIDGTSTHGIASCNEVACLADAGDFGQSCITNNDCTSGLVCVWGIGCTQTHGQCTPVSACNSFGTGMPPIGSTTFCDCSNHTVTVTTTCGIPQPYAHTGGCG